MKKSLSQMIKEEFEPRHNQNELALGEIVVTDEILNKATQKWNVYIEFTGSDRITKTLKDFILEEIVSAQ